MHQFNPDESARARNHHKRDDESRLPHASALGYALGPWPLVPLTGQVVREYPGVLEIYQTHLSFKATAAASLFLSAVAASNGGVSGSPDDRVDLAVGDESVTFVSAGAPDAGAEREIGTNVRLDQTILQIDLRGGSDLSVDLARRAAAAAVSLLQKTCSADL